MWNTYSAALQFESSYGTLAATAALEQRRKEALGASTEDTHALILKYRWYDHAWFRPEEGNGLLWGHLNIFTFQVNLWRHCIARLRAFACNQINHE